MSAAREFLKVLTNELDNRHIRYWIEKTRRHTKLHLDLPIGSRFHILPSTPSDRRGVKNSLAQLRRTLRSADAEAASALRPTVQNSLCGA